MLKLTQVKDGILLICGATGSGKSSTMAAMLNWINRNSDRHIVTIKDPIKYTFIDDKLVFQQREIGLGVPNLELAIRAVLRQNPDIILIGEMGDKETFEAAISAAETGHLVFSTMHAAGSSCGFICQKLILTIDGTGRVSANAVLNARSTVHNPIPKRQNDNLKNLFASCTDSNIFLLMLAHEADRGRKDR